MKVLIALALVSVALANAAVQPVRLPAPELPALETMPYVPEPIVIRPAFVNFEVPAFGETVQVVDNVEAAYEAVKVANLEEIVPAFDGEIPAEPVKFVNSEIIEEEIAAEELVVPAGEILPTPVKIVDVAENIDTPTVAKFESDAEDKVRVVNMPVRYPGKVFENPMLR